MRSIFLTALALSAVCGAANAQIGAPNPPALHNQGSLLWPRDDSFAYLRGHGIDKGEAADLTETLVPQGRPANISLFTSAATSPAAPVSARVPDYSTMPSSWTGTWEEWQNHQDMCATRYRTYDRSTDKYFYKVGAQQYCSLGLKDIR